MKGIQFVVDEAGEKRAVLIDLAEWGDLWEEFYDIIVARSRQDEEEVSWQELKTCKLIKGYALRAGYAYDSAQPERWQSKNV